MEIVDVYTRFHYNGGQNSFWSYSVFNQNGVELFHENGLISEKAGEIEPIMRGIEYCRLNNYKCNIHYISKIVFALVSDIIEGRPAWDARCELTKEYQQFIKKNRTYINDFIKSRPKNNKDNQKRRNNNFHKKKEKKDKPYYKSIHLLGLLSKTIIESDIWHNQSNQKFIDNITPVLHETEEFLSKIKS